MELQQNDLVVVPGLGVGRVGGLQEVDVGQTTIRAFCIDMGERDGKFWIPEDRVDAQGLRAPMDKGTAAEMIERIVEAEAPTKRANWRSRQKRYQEALASNQPDAIAEMIGELAAVRKRKRAKKQTLSFSERRLLERAKELLFGELAAATGKAREVFENSMTAALQSA